jgi:uroporphyrinogen decarboxylase
VTALERVLNTLAGRATDRVPVALHNYLMAAGMLNLPLDRYPKSGELMAKAHINAWEILGHDVIMVENGVTSVAEAIGSKVVYSAEQPPHVASCLLESLDEVNKLKVPDPYDCPSLFELLQACKLIKKHVGDRAFVMGRADQGPTALASALYGPERLVMEMAMDEQSDKIHALIDFCTRCTMRFVDAIKETGVEGTCIGGVGMSMVNPGIFRKYEAPYQKKYVNHCHAIGLLAGIHTCGREDEILDDIVSSGADWLELDSRTTPEKAFIATHDCCGLLGMVDPCGALMYGTPEQVMSECMNRLDTFKSARFLIGPGCALARDCPLENIKALVASVKKR